VPFLHFMNETGNLMWHNEPGLREMVILNPIEFFVKPATIIICKHSPDENDPTHHVSDLHKKASKKFMKKWIIFTFLLMTKVKLSSSYDILIILLKCLRKGLMI
jgi:hypothetical protein